MTGSRTVGFTFVEVLVACGVAAVVCAGVLLLLSAGARLVGDAERETTATWVAVAALERCRASSPTLGEGVQHVTREGGEATVETGAYEVRWRAQPDAALPRVCEAAVVDRTGRVWVHLSLAVATGGGA